MIGYEFWVLLVYFNTTTYKGVQHYCDSLKKPNTSVHNDVYNSSVGFFSAFWHQLSFSILDGVLTFHTGTTNLLFMLIVKEPEGNTHLIQQLKQTFLCYSWKFNPQAFTVCFLWYCNTPCKDNEGEFGFQKYNIHLSALLRN